MNKKIYVALIVVVISSAIYGFISIDRTPNRLAEQIVSGEDSKIAIKFTQYIEDFTKKNGPDKFAARFRSIPTEEHEYVRNLVLNLQRSENPEKITSPVMGCSDKYFVYFKDKNTGDIIRFTVKKEKKQWVFKGLREIKSE